MLYVNFIDRFSLVEILLHARQIPSETIFSWVEGGGMVRRGNGRIEVEGVYSGRNRWPGVRVPATGGLLSRERRSVVGLASITIKYRFAATPVRCRCSRLAHFLFFINILMPSPLGILIIREGPCASTASNRRRYLRLLRRFVARTRKDSLLKHFGRSAYSNPNRFLSYNETYFFRWISSHFNNLKT